MLRISVLTACSAALLVCACDDPFKKKPAPSPALAAAAPAADVASADQIRAELASQNFGRAAELAQAASAAHPGDAELHLLEARADGYLGRAPEAVAALEKAVLIGLPDRQAALSDPAFDRIRNDAAFRKLQGTSQAAAATRRAGRGAQRPDSIRAGDVEIREGNGRSRVRAGDIVLDEND